MLIIDILNMRMEILPILTVVLTTAVSAVLSDKTCSTGQQNSINSACDWECKLHQHVSGTCIDNTCKCDGQMGSESFEKLFENDNNDTLSGLPYFLKNVIFLPLTRTYIFRSRSDLLSPQHYGLDNAENFYIPTANGGVLGLWYIWPAHSNENIKHLSQNETLVVYMHGNSLDRGFFYRIGLYKMLISLGYHVLAFDYRSYGDSTRVALSETTTLEDGQAVLSWLSNMLDIKDTRDSPNIILWGHSLGTSIATRTLATSDARISAMVNGLILESPFNNMFDELHTFNTVTWSAWLLGIDIAETLQIADAEFRTEDYLGNITVPVLMLHAEDDKIVPSHLSEKMLQTAKNNHKVLDIELVLFPSDLNLRHKYIYRAPGIQNIIQTFTNKIK